MSMKHFLIIISVVCYTMANAQALHSDKEYIANPEYAWSDAQILRDRGDVEGAVKCYKLYSALTGKDMYSFIDALYNQSYPDWFNSSSMRAFPLSDGSVLILYNTLMTNSVWDSVLDEDLVISGLSGTWAREITAELYNAIAERGVYITSEGLYAGRSGVSARMDKTVEFSRGGRVIKKVNVPNNNKHYDFIIMTSTGKRLMDGGSYTEEGRLNGMDVLVTKKDSRNNYRFSYYPYRIIRKSKRIWIVEKNKDSNGNSASASHSITTIKSNI